MVPDIHAKFHNQQCIIRRAIKPFPGKLLDTRQQSAAALEGRTPRYMLYCQIR